MTEEQAPEPAASPGKDVFVSHASQDAAVANAVVAALESSGVTCWIAPRDVTPGEFYAESIVHAIDSTRIIVLVLSQSGANSQHVLREVERASSKRHAVISFRIDTAPLPAGLEYFLNSSQWLDATATGADRSLPRLVDAVKVALAQPTISSRAFPVPPAVTRSVGRGRPALVALAVVTTAALAYFAVDKFWLSRHRADQNKASTNPAITTSDKSIAVLPFENRSAKQDDAYFTDGIHDDILTQLTKIGAMKVIARTSVEQFRNTRLTTREIGAKLGVGRVLEGGVQRAGDRVRITVQLIDATTDTHLWAESYDRKLSAANIFSIQSEIALAIASALKAALSPDEQTRVRAVPTQNLDAWEAYQLGIQRGVNLSSEGLAASATYLQKAIDLDPGFALAYAELAHTLVLQIGWSGIPQATNLPRAEKLARKALELAPTLAQSWIASATVANQSGQVDRAEMEYRKAIALNPGLALAYRSLAQLLTVRERFEEALAYSKKSLDLDPLSPGAQFNYARTLNWLGRFDEADSHYRKVIELEPSRSSTYRDLAMMDAYAQNRFVEAISLAEKQVELNPDAPPARANLATIYVDLGDLAQAARVLEGAPKHVRNSADVLSALAYVRLFQGNEAEANRLARQALAIDPSQLPYLVYILGLPEVRSGHYAAARSWYARTYPELVKRGSPVLSPFNFSDALDLAYILRMTGETERAELLVAGAEQLIRKMARLGEGGYGIADVKILALRGEKKKALERLREAQRAGWRYVWQSDRDFTPSLSSIRDEPEFKAVFADIDRDMARQRAELAARPRNAPQEIKVPAH